MWNILIVMGTYVLQLNLSLTYAKTLGHEYIITPRDIKNLMIGIVDTCRLNSYLRYDISDR